MVPWEQLCFSANGGSPRQRSRNSLGGFLGCSGGLFLFVCGGLFCFLGKMFASFPSQSSECLVRGRRAQPGGLALAGENPSAHNTQTWGEKSKLCRKAVMWCLPELRVSQEGAELPAVHGVFPIVSAAPVPFSMSVPCSISCPAHAICCGDYVRSLAAVFSLNCPHFSARASCSRLEEGLCRLVWGVCGARRVPTQGAEWGSWGCSLVFWLAFRFLAL